MFLFGSLRSQHPVLDIDQSLILPNDAWSKPRNLNLYKLYLPVYRMTAWIVDVQPAPPSQ